MSGPGWHTLGEEEEALVVEVLRSRKLSRYRMADDPEPSKAANFETEFADRMGVDHCLGTNSCTSALLTGLLALGVGAGDEVIVPGYTFVATYAAIVYAGATPVLAEIDESLTLDPEDVRTKIGPRTKAILAVHMLGTPCDMAALACIADEHGLALIEDVAQACGASFDGQPLGSWGRFGAFSFNVFKVITAGDGGALTTKDRALFERAFSIHDHGFKRFGQAAIDGDGDFGLNFRIHELTAALALAQTRKLDSILARLRAQKRRLNDALGEPRGLKRRRLNDRKGECATTLVFLANDVRRAEALAESLGTRTLGRSVKHVYSALPALLEQRLPVPRCPFDCSRSPPTSYYPGMLPRTDDLLRRSVGIAVGVQDDYLGFGFGLQFQASDEEIEAVATQFLAASKVRT